MPFLEKIKQFIEQERLLSKGDVVVAGVSGGPDSVCLLSVLKNLQKSLHLKLVVAHLNHQLRGKEADLDEKFVRELAKQWSLPIYCKSVNIKKLHDQGKGSLEELSRESRYDFFQQVAIKVSANIVAVAHHADDQVETVLMRFLRGSGMSGLAGMLPKREMKVQSIGRGQKKLDSGTMLIRPLLIVSRNEILQYLKKKHLDYRIDQSNEESVYTRNKIRNQLLPLLEKEYNLQVKKAIQRMAQNFAEEEEFWESYLAHVFSSLKDDPGKDCDIYPVNEIFVQPVSVQRRWVRAIIEKRQGHLRQIDCSHIDKVVKLIKSGNQKTRVELPGELVIYLIDECLCIQAKKKKTRKALETHTLTMPGVQKLKDWKIQVTTELLQSGPELMKMILRGKVPSDTAYLDYQKIKGLLKIRTWKPGDRFIPLGMKGQKKLQDFFIDRKITLEKRHQVPLLCDRIKILWLMGVHLSEEVKVTKQSRKLVKIQISYL